MTPKAGVSSATTKVPNQLLCACQTQLRNMAVTPSKQRTVEFYLSSLWSWLPEGCKRILDALESCDLVSTCTTRPSDFGYGVADDMRYVFPY